MMVLLGTILAEKYESREDAPEPKIKI